MYKKFLYPSLYLLTSLLSLNIALAQSIEGRVLDQKNEPLDAVLIWLVKADSQKPIAQTISDEHGKFFLPTAKEKAYLMLSCLGYHSYNSPIFDASQAKDFKDIILNSSVNELVGLTVVAKKKAPLVERKAGKMIFNVASSISVSGANAFDLIRQLSGVSIDQSTKSILINGQDNNIVLINGKQTHLTSSEVYSLLKSTAALNISKIEVLSNASARYSAEGSGKIINIILKKERNDGYNLSLNLGFAYWLNPKHNAELSFNHKKNKLNLYANYSHNFGYVNYFYGKEREQNGQLIKSKSDDTDKRNTIALTLGADYQFSERHSLDTRLSGNSVFGPGGIQTNNIIYDLANPNRPLYSIYSESNYYHQRADRYSSATSYKWQISKQEKFNLDLDFAYFSGDGRIRQPNTYYSPLGEIDSLQNYRTEGLRDIKIFGLSSDYERPLWQGKLSCGVKYASVHSSNDYKLYNSLASEDLLDYKESNLFKYNESVLATYLSWAWLHDKWSLDLGLRAEQTFSKAHLTPFKDINSNKEERHNRDYLDFFPNIRLGYRLSDAMALDLSYAKRIDRPVYSDLNPISQALDGLSSWQGNPFLKPQISHRIELAYQIKKANISLAYTQKNDYFVSVTDTLGAKGLVMKPMNLGQQKHFEISYAQNLRLARLWTANLSASLFYLHNQMAFDMQRSYLRQRWAYNCTLQTVFPLFWGMKAQLNAAYHSRRLGGATEIMADNGSVDVSLQRSFLDKHLSVNLSMTDLFWTGNWDSVDEREGFRSNSYGYGESRLLKLNLSYHLGRPNKKATKSSKLDAELNRL